MSRNLRRKNVTIWASRKARAPKKRHQMGISQNSCPKKTSPYGHLAKLVPQKIVCRKNFIAQIIRTTSRDRPKSTPYPRLKNSKRTSKCQFTVLENRKSKKMDRVARRGPLAQAPGALKGGHFRKCQHFCRS